MHFEESVDKVLFDIIYTRDDLFDHFTKSGFEYNGGCIHDKDIGFCDFDVFVRKQLFGDGR